MACSGFIRKFDVTTFCDSDNFFYLFNRGLKKVEAEITYAHTRKEYIGKVVALSQLVTDGKE